MSIVEIMGAIILSLLALIPLNGYRQKSKGVSQGKQMQKNKQELKEKAQYEKAVEIDNSVDQAKQSTVDSIADGFVREQSDKD